MTECDPNEHEYECTERYINELGVLEYMRVCEDCGTVDYEPVAGDVDESQYPNIDEVNVPR